MLFVFCVQLTPAPVSDKVLQRKDAPVQDEQNQALTRSFPLWKRPLIYVVILVVGFLLGLVPMWLTARQRGKELEVTRAELQRSQMRSALSGAAVDARRGDYEPARKAMSDFFTTLSSELDRGEESALDQTQRDKVRPLLAQRDEIITLLARSDPAAADRLSDLDSSYRKATADVPPVNTMK